MPLSPLIKDSSSFNGIGLANAQVSLSAINGAGAFSLLFAAGQVFPNPVIFPTMEGLFQFGTGDFTVEGYAYPTDSTTATNGQLALLIGSGSWQLDFSSGAMRLRESGTAVITGATALTLNALNHWRLSRIGTSVRLWLNGVQQGSTWTSSLNWASCQIRWGGDNTRANIIGYHSEFRVTNGNGRDSTAFTPPYAAWPTDVGGDALWGSVVLLAKGDEGSFGATAVLPSLPNSFPIPAPAFMGFSQSLAGPTLLNPLLNFGTRGLSGVVDYITTPAAGRIVRAYDKASGILLRETTTAGDGTYSFPDLLGNRDYYVVALDSPPNPASAWDTDISPIVQAT